MRSEKIFSIYLHKDIVDILKCFGDLNTVVNNILDACETGAIDWYNKPAAPQRDGAGRYNILVTNQAYLADIEMYGELSSFISLRRLIYWFVLNEIFEELDWKPLISPKSEKNKKYNIAKAVAIKSLEKFAMLETNPEQKSIINKMLTQLENFII